MKQGLNFCEAGVAGMPQIRIGQNAVKENTLSMPAPVTDRDGDGWAYETDEHTVGLPLAGLKESNVWALFVDPEFEVHGTGRWLHDVMPDGYFFQTDQTR